MSAAVGPLVTFIALLGLLIARRGVDEAAATSDVAARLRTLYTLLAVLLVLRILAAMAAATPLVVALMAVAAWLPFAGVRLVEELCRRHAPRSVKILAVGGALVFTLIAVTFGLVWSDRSLVALASYQILMLASMVWLLARARGDLAPAERETADTFLLALMLAIPLAATDFKALYPDLPVRGGAIAVLVLVVATSRMVVGRGTPTRLLADLGMMVGSAGATVLLGRLASPAPDWSAAPALGAGGGAIAALLLLTDRAAARRSRQTGLIAALAGAPGTDPEALVSAHPLLETGRILEGADLAGYPPAVMVRLLDHRVVGRDMADPEVRDAGRDLLDGASATHLLRISRDPPRLLAISAASLAGRMLDDELEIAARLIERAS